MVRSGHPAGVLAVHAGLADENIVKGIVKHVAHVKYSRHIWRRNHYGIRLFFIRFTVEKLMGKPVGIPLVFYVLSTVLCG